jgi:hypothetical protein
MPHRTDVFGSNGMNKSLTVVIAFSLALIFAAAAKSTAPINVPLPRNNPLKQTQQEKKQNSPPASALFSEMKLATTRAGVFKVASNFRRQGRRGK